MKILLKSHSDLFKVPNSRKYETKQLEQHFESCHGRLVGKMNYFWQKSEDLFKWHLEFGEMSVKQNEIVWEISYAFRIASAKKPHIIDICDKK